MSGRMLWKFTKCAESSDMSKLKLSYEGTALCIICHCIYPHGAQFLIRKQRCKELLDKFFI